MCETINCYVCGKEFEEGETGSDWRYCSECTRTRNRARYHARMERNRKEPDPYVNCSTCGTRYLKGIIGSEGLHCPECTRERNRNRYRIIASRPTKQYERECSVCGGTFINGEDGSFRGKCPKCRNEYLAKRIAEHKDEIYARRKVLYDENKDGINEKRREEYKTDPIKQKQGSMEYYYKNKPKIREYKRKYVKTKCESDIEYRLTRTLRSRVRVAIKNQNTKKSGKTFELIGCSIEELRKHIESQWQPGMSWDNWGNGKGKWNIDHRLPIAAFKLSDPEQQKIVFNWKNMAPLWYEDNMKKMDRMPDGTLGRYLKNK
jgi:hypothetical protein